MAAERTQTVVPLYAPSTSQLRAGAVWVTISNWAEALADRFGDAEIVTPAGSLSAASVRNSAWDPSRPTTSAALATRAPDRKGPELATKARGHARTLAKDIRWGWWATDAWRRVRTTDLRRFHAAPFVWQHHDLFERPGFSAARRLDVPLVLFVDAPQVWEGRLWGVERPGWGNALQRAAERPQFIAADVVACVSEEVANEVTTITGGRAHVVVTPCTATKPQACQGGQRREELKLDGRFVIGWVGSFRRFHHADMLVRLVAALVERGTPATLLMVGDGPTRADCEALASSLGIDARFVGRVSNRDVSGFLQACDVGVLPAARGDAFHYSPLKLKEYLAAGLPTVVPMVGEMVRTLQTDAETLFFDPGDERGLADQVHRLAVDADLRATVAAGGARRLQASFSMATQLAVVESALSRRRS